MLMMILAAASSLCVGDRCPCTDGPDYMRVLNPKTLQIETTTKDLNADLCQAMKDTQSYDPKRNLELQRELIELHRWARILGDRRPGDRASRKP